jgi:hypothetical protein
MGIFDDKKFEQLDWMTQITEVIESDLNTILAKLPDVIDVNADFLVKNMSSGTILYTNDIIRPIIRNLTEKDLSWDEENMLSRCFKFTTSPNAEYNFEANTLEGSITLTKVEATFSDEELQKMMGRKGITAVCNVDFGDANEWPLVRLNEILDILGDSEQYKRNRSYRKKMWQIENRLKEIFAGNEWRIRDMNLADQIGRWIVSYIEDGNLSALTNLCKLKVMTHSSMPIYSMVEEK